MMRMTISPSRGILLATAALMARPLAAQDSTQVMPPAPAERPARHVVQAGETLWSLAQLYLGDPFLWPEIYRLNLLVVEDPHWIYPGEELLLAVADLTAAPVVAPAVEPAVVPAPAAGPPPVAVPVQPTDSVARQDQAQGRPVEAPPVVPPMDAPDLAPPPPPTEQNTPTVFARRRQPTGGTLVGGTPTFPYRAVHSGDFYASGFLTEGEDLPWARVLGPIDRNRGIPRRGSASATRFERIIMVAPAGATYHVGDSLLVATLGPQVPDWGRIVVPSGIARVVAVDGRDVEAEIVAQFDRIADDQVAIPVEPFRDPGVRRPVPVEQGMMAEVISNRDGNPLALQQGILFINKGRADGVVTGDVFELQRPAGSERPEGAAPEALGLLQIVHVRDGSATGRLLQVFGAGIRPGVPARLIRKMPG